MKKVLFVNGCVREKSRTQRLAEMVLSQIKGEVEELKLEREPLLPLNAERLSERERLLAAGALDAEPFRYARQFAEADEIVMAAPVWDLSIPAALKTYLENICVCGITFYYDDTGVPQGLCRAERLTFVTTSGGKLEPTFGYGNISALCKTMFGISDVPLYGAEMLDIRGNDVEYLMTQAEEQILTGKPIVR